MNKNITIHQKNDYYPDRILIQWHITEQCNLRCKHCYQNTYHADNSNKLHDTFIKIKKFIYYIRSRQAYFVPAHITITGGEPMLSPMFWSIMDAIAKKNHKIGFSILTNGSLIDKTNVARLASLNPCYIQLSIEGGETLHDSIRGKGNYQTVCNTARLLIKNKITTSLSFTAHKQNMGAYQEVVATARKLKVNRVWTDRLIPDGSATALIMMNKDDTKQYVSNIKKQHSGFKSFFFPRTKVSMHRALQFLGGGTSNIYSCSAGNSLITIGAAGEIWPCRRMPHQCGNIYTDDLKDVYQQSALFRALRNPINVPDDCSFCKYIDTCKGGLKCLSYALTSSPFERDPGCFLKS